VIRNLNIFSPNEEFDWRVSVNMEVPSMSFLMALRKKPILVFSRHSMICPVFSSRVILRFACGKPIAFAASEGEKKVEKTKVANLNIFSPNEEFDWRVSVNMEVPSMSFLMACPVFSSRVILRFACGKPIAFAASEGEKKVSAV
jgi:hypothetical protein